MSHRNVQVYDDVREMRYQTAVSTLLLSATTSIALACATTAQEQTSMKAQFPPVSWASGIDTRVATGLIANNAGAFQHVYDAGGRWQWTCNVSSGRRQTTKHAYPWGPVMARVEPPPKMVCASERSLQRDHMATLSGSEGSAAGNASQVNPALERHSLERGTKHACVTQKSRGGDCPQWHDHHPCPRRRGRTG
jgi:hypothetical protein